jgi:chromodomain-helicase-DNA-binding protein 4
VKPGLPRFRHSNIIFADSDQDLDKLIEKTETEEGQEETDKASNLQFSFAKVWAADKDELEEVPESAGDGPEQGDSWAQTLQRIAEEQSKGRAEEATGRRRRAAALAAQVHIFSGNAY